MRGASKGNRGRAGQLCKRKPLARPKLEFACPIDLPSISSIVNTAGLGVHRFGLVCAISTSHRQVAYREVLPMLTARCRQVAAG